MNAYGLPVDLSKNYLKVNVDDLDEEPGYLLILIFIYYYAIFN